MKHTTLKASLLTVILASITSPVTWADDTSAALTISGQLAPATSQCKLFLSENTIDISADLAELKPQDQPAHNPHQIHVRVDGDYACEKAKSIGAITLKFNGVADEGNGTSLMNSATGDGAAQGIGIGLFDAGNNPLTINQSVLLATEPAQTFGVELVTLIGKTATTGSVQGALTVEMNQL